LNRPCYIALRSLKQPVITHTEHLLMAQSQRAVADHYPTNPDQPEIKRCLPNTRPDIELSEWDRARQTSKTWSMEQD